MTSKIKGKVWICTVDFFDDYRIVHVYSKKEDADNWLSQVAHLNSTVTYADHDKSVKAAKKKKQEYEVLGLEYHEFDYGPNVKEYDVK